MCNELMFWCWASELFSLCFESLTVWADACFMDAGPTRFGTLRRTRDLQLTLGWAQNEITSATLGHVTRYYIARTWA